jgi:hypothetical protein
MKRSATETYSFNYQVTSSYIHWLEIVNISPVETGQPKLFLSASSLPHKNIWIDPLEVLNGNMTRLPRRPRLVCVSQSLVRPSHTLRVPKDHIRYPHLLFGVLAVVLPPIPNIMTHTFTGDLISTWPTPLILYAV